MIALLQNWIIRKIETGRFSKRRDVFWFALSRTVWTTTAAVVLNFAVHAFFSWSGFLDLAVPPNSIGDTIVTALVAGPISMLTFYIFGSAMYDLSVSSSQYEHLSRTDPLTGLMNRRAFVDHIESLGSRYVLVLFDIDRFKSINDIHGHGTGDEILIAVSGMFKAAFGTRAVARLGGEEFAAVICGLTGVEAMEKINDLREEISGNVFRFGDVGVHVTFSAGVAEADGEISYSSLLNLADKALYLAKASGRNRIVHADELGVILPANEGLLSRHAI